MNATWGSVKSASRRLSVIVAVSAMLAAGKGHAAAAPPAETAKPVAPAAVGVDAAARALDDLASRGLDWTVLHGVASASENREALAGVRRALAALEGVTLTEDQRAVLLGRARVIAALAGPAPEREALLRAASADLRGVEGPPTAGEASRRVTLAAALVGLGDRASISEARGLARTVLDLPRGEDALRQVPRGVHVEAMLVLIRTAPGEGQDPAALARVAGEQFGEARERLLTGEALARALAPAAGAPAGAWEAAIAPLAALGEASLGAMSADEVRAMIEGKIAALCDAETDTTRLPTRALLTRGTIGSLMAVVERDESDDVVIDALWRLADAQKALNPPARGEEIDALGRLIDRAPKHARAEEALRRAIARTEDWEKAVMDAPWRKAKPPGDAAGADLLEPAMSACRRVIASARTLGRTDATIPRLWQRVARLAIRAGKARGPMGDLALRTLVELTDDPAVSGDTVALAREWLALRHPKDQPADAQRLAADLDALSASPTIRRQPYQLASWRVTLAEAQQRQSLHEAALATWSTLADAQTAAYVSGDMERALLGMAKAQEDLGRLDDALGTLARITDRFEQALAGQRPGAYWDAVTRTLRIQLRRDPSAGAAAAVRLRIRQLRATDATLGGVAWRAELEKVDAEAAGR